MNGSVKFYNTEKAYGFVTGEDGQDYFFHRSAIINNNESLKKGDNVVFETQQGDRGLKAVRVQLET